MQGFLQLIRPLLISGVSWALIGMILVLLSLAILFAAVTFVLRIRNEKRERTWSRLEEEWKPWLLEVLDDPTRLDELWGVVGEAHRDFFLDFLLRYSGRLKDRDRRVLQRAAAPYLSGVVGRLESRQAGIRARAVQILGTLGLPAYTEEITRAMDDPSPLVAVVAARLLAREVGAPLANQILASLDRFRAFSTWYVVDMIVAMGPDAIPAVRAAMASAALPHRSRAIAAQVLARVRDPASADLAADLARTETDPDLLAALLGLLGKVGTPVHAQAVRAHLESEPFFVRMAALRTLAELGSREDLPLLFERLEDSSPWVAVAAARGVFRLGGEELAIRLSGEEAPTRRLFRQVLAEEASS